MMKRFRQTLCLIMGTMLMIPFSAKAVSAYPEPITVIQPDGTQITIRLHGSERQHYTRTIDNYTLLQDTDGYYKYAIDSMGFLKPGKLKAHNPENRKAEELLLLNKIPTNLKRQTSGSQIGSVNLVKSSEIMQKIHQSQSGLRSAITTTSKYLVILINFADATFTKTNADFANMLNQAGYNVNGATGSVKDYYAENSMNSFTPQYDVYGPVTLSQSIAYYGANDADGDDLRPREMILDACAKVNSLYNVNFSQYDNDKDGSVDNIAVFFAGYAESSGAPATTIWPHQWDVSGLTTGVKQYNNVKLGSYSCSSELKGISGSTMEGIGTFCHEFGHVLGLPDLYDTDYEDNGDFFDSNAYNLMASGNYNNSGRTPPYLSIFEREILGWSTSGILSKTTKIENLEHIGASNKAYYMLTNPAPAPGASETEYFYLENRQKTGWDTYIPGHGLIITHVDLSKEAISKYWQNGKGNAYASHPCYDLMEADGIMDNATRAGDPFPGTSGRTYFTDTDTPNAISWSGLATNKPITDITETDQKISFNFMSSSSGISTEVEPVSDENGITITVQNSQIVISNLSDESTIQLYDMSGKMTKLLNSRTDLVSIPVEKKGIFIVRVSQNGISKSYKVPVLE